MPRLSQRIDERLGYWIAYRLGGGSQEHLDSILSAAGRSPGQRERRLEHALAASEPSPSTILGPRLLAAATKARSDLARQGVATIDPGEVCESANLEELPPAFQLEKSFFFRLAGDLFRQAGEELGRLLKVAILRPQQVEGLPMVLKPAEEQQTEEVAPLDWHLDHQAVLDLLTRADQLSEGFIGILLALRRYVSELGQTELTGEYRHPDFSPVPPDRLKDASIDVQKIVERLLSELTFLLSWPPPGLWRFSG